MHLYYLAWPCDGPPSVHELVCFLRLATIYYFASFFFETKAPQCGRVVLILGESVELSLSDVDLGGETFYYVAWKNCMFFC